MTCASELQLTCWILLALTCAASGDDTAKRFVAEEDNFSVVMPGQVTTKQLSPNLRQYSCVVQESPTKQARYLITAAKVKTSPDAMSGLRAYRDDVLTAMRKDYHDLSLVWTTPLRCSGYPGLQYVCIFDKIKRPAFGPELELPSGYDVRLIRTGDHEYGLSVYNHIYQGMWAVATCYNDTPEDTKQFFASFRLLKKAEMPAVRARESIVGEWAKNNNEQAVGGLGLADRPDFLFRENGEALLLGVLKGRYTTNEDQEPRQIDLVIDVQDKNIRKGIYRITDGELEMCMADATAIPRPTRFEAADGTLWKLRRPGDAVLPDAK